ncbi:hypothetical protein QQ045_026771 [Rhodiola kirilowii]
MGTKMKGLIKGFRYISQIFEEDKEPEMQIGLPTDVKHVAHIGWDGPSVNSPSWMTNFKSDPDFASSGLTLPEDATRDLPPIKPPSEDSSGRRSRRASESAPRELPDLPKATRRHTSSNGGTIDTTVREKSEKRHSRRHQSGDESKESSSGQSRLGISQASPGRKLPDIPKKSRRKKTIKDPSVGGSTRSSSKANAASSSCGYASPYSDPGTGTLPGSSLMDDTFSDIPSRNLQAIGHH